MDTFLAFFPQILKGTWLTIQVAFSALVLGLFFGILGALAESAKSKSLRNVATVIISTIRGLPELLVLFFIYFGGTLLLSELMHHYVNVSAFFAGFFALGLIFGSYASQTFRGAFLAIPTGQLEAAKALGLNRRQIFKLIQLPQAWRHALPGLSNQWLVLLKDTALVSLIGLADLMNKAQVAASTTHKPFLFYLSAAFIYLLLTSLSQGVMKQLTLRATRHLSS